MLWTLIVILLLLWMVGIATAYTFGGVVHILLLIAVLLIIVRLIRSRPVS